MIRARGARAQEGPRPPYLRATKIRDGTAKRLNAIAMVTLTRADITSEC